MKVEHLEYHHAHEATHWWFVARRRIVTTFLDDVVRELDPEQRSGLRLLDVGCGAGGFLETLRRFGNAFGVDPSPAAIEFARSKSAADVRRGSLPDDLPFAGAEFDVITLLDVLEHVDEDERALRTLAGLLRPGGYLIITVPAFRFLWSAHDEVNEHRRRYTRDELEERLHAAGFQVRKISYFNTFLFPPIAAMRFLARVLGRNGGANQGIVPGPVNALLTFIFSSERHVLRRGSLPFGVSLFALARRPPAGAGPGVG